MPTPSPTFTLDGMSVTGSFLSQSTVTPGGPSITTRPTTGRPLPPIVTRAVAAGRTSTGSCHAYLCWDDPPPNSVTIILATNPGPGTTRSKANLPSASVRVSY